MSWGLVDLGALLREQTALAEALLLFANQIAGNNELTIIALGKFGGRELSYGADLDVLFVGKDIRAAQHLISASAQPSAEGNLPRSIRGSGPTEIKVRSSVRSTVTKRITASGRSFGKSTR